MKNLNLVKKEENLIGKYRFYIMGFAALWILCFHTWMPIFYNNIQLSNIEKFIKSIGFLRR